VNFLIVRQVSTLLNLNGRKVISKSIPYRREESDYVADYYHSFISFNLIINIISIMKLSIIIITDDIIFPNLFEILLQRMIPELTIEICGSDKVICKKLNIDNYSLIILDGEVSKFSPTEILQHIRLISKIKVPIWFFPEIRTKAYIDKMYEMGVSRMITKPFDPYIITAEMVSSLVK